MVYGIVLYPKVNHAYQADCKRQHCVELGKNNSCKTHDQKKLTDFVMSEMGCSYRGSLMEPISGCDEWEGQCTLSICHFLDDNNIVIHDAYDSNHFKQQ